MSEQKAEVRANALPFETVAREWLVKIRPPYMEIPTPRRCPARKDR